MCSLAHGDGDIDAKVAVVCEQLSNARIEDEAVGVEDGGGDALVNGTRRRLPRQPAPVSVQFQPGIIFFKIYCINVPITISKEFKMIVFYT